MRVVLSAVILRDALRKVRPGLGEFPTPVQGRPQGPVRLQEQGRVVDMLCLTEELLT
jgi:hypothetical protein